MPLSYLLWTGVALLFFWVLYRRFTGGFDRFFTRFYYPFILVMFSVLVLLMLLIALNRGFSIDEFEHIHSAWYVQQGAVPYTGFFQHHHPLIWYLALPVLALLGHSAGVALALRVMMFLWSLGTALLVYRVGVRLTGSKEGGLIPVVFLLSTVMFAVFAIQVRPDVPQVFFGLLSFLFLLRFFQERKPLFVVLSGFSTALSFLFLQKTLFLLIGYGLLFLYSLWKRKISLGNVLWFAGAFFLPLGIYLGYLVWSGSFNDYLLNNWWLNMNFARGDRFSLFMTLNYYILKDFFLWLGVILFYTSLMSKKREGKSWEMKVTGFLGGILFATLFFIKRPWGHNFLFLLVFLALMAGIFLFRQFEKYRVKETVKALVLLLVVLNSLYFLVIRTQNDNRLELERAAYVLAHTQPGDYVYDGKNLFNLFRPDLHYFWFSLKENHGLDTYNRVTGGKYGDYDICRLVKEKKPKFISDFRLDLEECGLDNLYRKTPYENLYIRRDER